jgi:hypothetical protein
MTSNISSAQLASLSLPKTAAPVAAKVDDGAGGGLQKRQHRKPAVKGQL